MRMEKFTYTPAEYQNHIHAEGANKDLAGAIHVDTYTKDAVNWGGEKTIVVFAFFPDEKAKVFEDVDLEEAFLREATFIYDKWNKQAEEYRESHKNRSAWRRIVDKLTFNKTNEKSGLSHYSEFNNITLARCEDLDDVMGSFFGAGTWRRHKDNVANDAFLISLKDKIKLKGAGKGVYTVIIE